MPKLNVMILKSAVRIPILILTIFISCSQTGSDFPEPRPYVVEETEDTAVLNVYADGFHDLNLQEKVVSYYLYHAAMNGIEFFYNPDWLIDLNGGAGIGSSDNGDHGPENKIDMTIELLEKASSYTTEKHKKELLELADIISNVRIGDLEKFRNLWIDSNSNVTFLNSFIAEPEGYEPGGVFFTDIYSEKTMKGLVKNISSLVNTLPWPDEFKIKDQGIINIKPQNILLGNNLRIRLPFNPVRTVFYQKESAGNGKSKVYYFSNISKSLRKSLGYTVIEEFAKPVNIEVLKAYSDTYEPVFDMLKEVVRLAALKKQGVNENNGSDILYTVLADLSALYLLTEPVMHELKLIEILPNTETVFEAYLIRSLFNLKYFDSEEKGARIRSMASKIVLQYLLEESGGVNISRENGKSLLEISAPDKIENSSAELIREIADIITRNDQGEIDNFIYKYALGIEKVLAEEIVNRCRAINYPEYIALSYPLLESRLNDNDGIVDVLVKMPGKSKSP